MTDELRFEGRVAVVTGAGNGLGRSHALLLARRGCKVVVNDLGGSAHGTGASTSAADKVVAEIKAAGGEAAANYDSVEDGDKIVKSALDAFGRVDIVVNNAGILRDVSFQKMTQEDWDLVYRVHVLGAFRVTHAAWPHLRAQGYGRVIFTASAAGIYGNFGQANYSMAKLGLAGLASTLALEGKKNGVRVNTIAPIAGSRMTETVLPKELLDVLLPEYVSPLVAWLCSEKCEETGGLFEVGGGFVSKLRWERTKGKTFKLGREITPEQLERAWGEVTDFTGATHPPTIAASMEPVLGNVGSRSHGGNELIDVDAALGYEYPPLESRYDERDMALYALGVGAAANPLDPKELQYVYEMNPDGFRTLPTYGVIPAINAMLTLAREGRSAPGLNYGFDRILHGEQYTELKRPLPEHATLTHRLRVKDIFDKGKHALVVVAATSTDESGAEIVYNEFTTFVRGAGGWGGERGPSQDVNAPPDRAPDATVTEKISESQALLYRLSGDWNPLHADPGFAKNFGFPKPILHGLCTFGYAGRHVIANFAPNGDARYFKSIKTRFADSVFPGETLVTEMWKESDTRVVFRCRVKERDKVAISNAAIEFYTEIPSAKPAAAAASAPAAATKSASAGSPSDDVFWGIRWYVGEHPELVQKVGTIFQFKLTGPEKLWTVDLKNGKGSVTAGAGGEKPEVTLELSNEDFIGMATGKLNPQKLYFAGKLKIGGNVMASQKLDFLTKVDSTQVRAAMKAAGYVPSDEAGDASAPGAAVPPTAGTTLGSADVFAVIGDYIAKHPELVAQAQTVFQFKLVNPPSDWTVDVKNGAGSVTAGIAAKADCTLELSDEDFMAMTSGKADPQKLFLGGKLKIGGNVMASQKLMFLKKIDPNDAKAVLAQRSASPPAAATGASPPPAAKTANAAAVFKALGERVAANGGLAGEVGATVQWRVTEPASEWVMDLASAPGSVKAGALAGAALTLTLTDEALGELAKGGGVREMYQQGKIRADGDVRIAHRLGFIKDLL